MNRPSAMHKHVWTCCDRQTCGWCLVDLCRRVEGTCLHKLRSTKSKMNTQGHKTEKKTSECLEITPVTIHFLLRVRHTCKTREDQSLTSHTLLDNPVFVFYFCYRPTPFIWTPVTSYSCDLEHVEIYLHVFLLLNLPTNFLCISNLGKEVKR